MGIPQIDTYNITIEDGITVVTCQSTIPGQRFKSLLNFASEAYRPVVLAVDISDRDKLRYAIAQAPSKRCIDLRWAQNALSRFEPGWTIQDEVLSSPDPSQLKEEAILELIGNATLAETAELEVAQSTGKEGQDSNSVIRANWLSVVVTGIVSFGLGLLLCGL